MKLLIRIASMLVLVTPTLAELNNNILASVGVTRTSVLAMRISIYLPNQKPQDLNNEVSKFFRPNAKL